MNYFSYPSQTAYLAHWGFKKGAQKEDHKYSFREWVNGKWKYYYGPIKDHYEKQADMYNIRDGVSKINGEINRSSDYYHTHSPNGKAQFSIDGSRQEKAAREKARYLNEQVGIKASLKKGASSVSHVISSNAKAAATKISDLGSSVNAYVQSGKKKISSFVDKFESEDSKRAKAAIRQAEIANRNRGRYDRLMDASKGSMTPINNKSRVSRVAYEQYGGKDPIPHDYNTSLLRSLTQSKNAAVAEQRYLNTKTGKKQMTALRKKTGADFTDRLNSLTNRNTSYNQGYYADYEKRTRNRLK